MSIQDHTSGLSSLPNRDEIRAMRRSYGEAGLDESSVPAHPIELFALWLTEAAANPFIVEPNAMVLSTVDSEGPASRSVLLKEVSPEGFIFFTNYQSSKGRAIESEPRVSLLFPWYPMERQVIVRGSATKVSTEASSEYFATRPWASQIGAWASAQSEHLESRELLQARFDDYASRFPEGSEVPTPPHWGGFLVTPQTIEFWQGRYSRLHDRLKYRLDAHHWQIERLNP